MVNSINGDSLTTLLKQISSKAQNSDDELFKKLSEDVGGDGKTITKQQLEDYIAKVESNASVTEDKGKLGFLKQLDKNWDKISNGSDSITSADLKAGKSYLAPPKRTSEVATDLFTSLADTVGASSEGITKDDLTNYFKSLLDVLKTDSATGEKTDSTSEAAASSYDSTGASTSAAESKAFAAELRLITTMLNNFEQFTDDSGFITSSSLQNAQREPQDPSSISASQLQLPIDLRV